jgi:hypothetical protein
MEAVSDPRGGRCGVTSRRRSNRACREERRPRGVPCGPERFLREEAEDPRPPAHPSPDKRRQMATVSRTPTVAPERVEKRNVLRYWCRGGNHLQTASRRSSVLWKKDTTTSSATCLSAASPSPPGPGVAMGLEVLAEHRNTRRDHMDRGGCFLSVGGLPREGAPGGAEPQSLLVPGKAANSGADRGRGGANYCVWGLAAGRSRKRVAVEKGTGG